MIAAHIAILYANAAVLRPSNPERRSKLNVNRLSRVLAAPQMKHRRWRIVLAQHGYEY
jgi:hypothetical protein